MLKDAFAVLLVLSSSWSPWWRSLRKIKSCRLTNVMETLLMEPRFVCAEVNCKYPHLLRAPMWALPFYSALVFPLPKSLPHFLFISLLPCVHPSLFLSSSLSNSFHVLTIVALSHRYCWYPPFIISFIVNSDKKDGHGRGERWTVWSNKIQIVWMFFWFNARWHLNSAIPPPTGTG